MAKGAERWSFCALAKATIDPRWNKPSPWLPKRSRQGRVWLDTAVNQQTQTFLQSCCEKWPQGFQWKGCGLFPDCLPSSVSAYGQYLDSFQKKEKPGSADVWGGWRGGVTLGYTTDPHIWIGLSSQPKLMPTICNCVSTERVNLWTFSPLLYWGHSHFAWSWAIGQGMNPTVLHSLQKRERCFLTHQNPKWSSQWLVSKYTY